MLSYNQKFITLDAETEGLCTLTSCGSRPWDLSWIETSGDYILKEEQNYINIPNLNLSDKIKFLTHFNKEEYDKKKQNQQVVWDKLKKVLYNEDYYIIGQNILFFDIFMIGRLATMCGEQPDWSFLPRVLDTRPLALAYKEGIEKTKEKNLLNWQYRILSQRYKSKVGQEALLKAFSIEYDPKKLHGAIYDCSCTYKIFQYLRKKLEI
jgi:DNA polymerase III epsilon subunit-like protein